MKHPYSDRLKDGIDRLYPGASDHLDAINELPDSAAKSIVAFLVSCACEPQNTGLITLARSTLAELPAVWLSSVLGGSIKESVNLDDEWEYRRLIELLGELNSALLQQYLDYGLASEHAEIREAASDYAGA